MKSRRKKVKKISAKSLHNKIWPLCKAIIRAKYGNTCFTCDAKNLVGQNCQTGHFIPRSVCGAYLKYCLTNLRIQCASCNIWRGGNGAVFYRRMVETEGQEYVDNIFAKRALEFRVKLKDRIEELLPKYQKLAEELLKTGANK